MAPHPHPAREAEGRDRIPFMRPQPVRRLALACVLALLVALVVPSVIVATPPPGTNVVAYFEGNLVTVRLERLPEHAARGALDRNDQIGVFFDGLVGVCYPAPDSGAVFEYCLFSWVTPVLASIEGNPLCRPVEIFVDPDLPEQEFTTYSDIEAAAQRGDIQITPLQAVYRCSVGRVPNAKRDRPSAVEPARKTAAETTSWGTIKGLFR